VPEDSIINRACEALGGLERSQLVQEAALSEANRMGIRWSVDRPPPLTDPWPHLPDRSAEATAVRVTISVSVLGATLAYIGRLQRCFEGAAAGTPEERTEGERMRAALQRIKLPPQYVYRGRRAK
jgi:hypothetical protein